MRISGCKEVILWHLQSLDLLKGSFGVPLDFQAGVGQDGVPGGCLALLQLRPGQGEKQEKEGGVGGARGAGGGAGAGGAGGRG